MTWPTFKPSPEIRRLQDWASAKVGRSWANWQDADGLNATIKLQDGERTSEGKLSGLHCLNDPSTAGRLIESLISQIEAKS